MLHSIELNEIHVLGLQSFRTFLHFKGNARALIERAVSTGRDRGEVHEDIFSILSLDKSKSLRGVKPLHCSCFFQNDSFYFYKCCANVSIDDGGTGEESKTRKPVQRNSKDVQVQLRFSLALQPSVWGRRFRLPTKPSASSASYLPFPVSLIDCGEPAALSAIATDALRLPLAEGLNVTEMLHFPPAATEVPQVFV